MDYQVTITPRAAGTERKEYSYPQLLVLGDLAELTAYVVSVRAQ
jgi:hypothetical protein